MTDELLAQMHPELREILDKKPHPTFPESIPVSVIRGYQEQMQNAAPQPDLVELGVEEEDRTITMRDGVQITIRIYRPLAPPEDGSPIFVVYHGGGFCLGNIKSEEDICHDWVTNFRGVAVNVDYRLRPEYQYPVPQLDSFDALKWVAANLNNLGVKTNPKAGFIVGGASAGGSLTTVVSHLYRDEKISPPLTGVYLGAPSVLRPELTPDAFPEKYRAEYTSKALYDVDPVLNASMRKYFDSQGLVSEKETYDPLLSPLFFSSHADLPPAYIQACGMDPLRDQARVWEKILREDNGIKTKIDIFPGLPHVFWTVWKQATFSKEHRVKTIEGLRWLLETARVKKETL